MIRTGGNVEGRIILTDDVCRDNISLIKNWHSDCSLYIDKRFEVPPVSYQFKDNFDSDTIGKIARKLIKLEDKVKAGEKTFIVGETPLKNFMLKVNFWYINIFREVIRLLDDGEHDIKVLINSNVSKHEWVFIQWLAELGVNFLVITKDLKRLDTTEYSNIEIQAYNSNQNINFIQSSEELKSAEVIENFKTLSDIEQALYEKGNQVNVVVLGMSNYIDTCDFYGKLYKNCEVNESYKLFINGLDRPTQDETSSIPRFSKTDHDYIVATLLMYVKVDNKNRKEELKNILRKEFSDGEDASLNGTILYNKMSYAILVLNKIIDAGYKKIVYYGRINKNDTKVLGILKKLSGISVIVLMSDKQMINNELKEAFNVLELEASAEYFDIPTADSRDNAKTLAAVAQRRTDDVLYGSNALGMYKPGMFTACTTKLFTTAYEEIELWWNKDMYIRPEFKAEGFTTQLPTMFKVIKGVPTDKTVQHYLDHIQSLLFGNTLFCRSRFDLKALSCTDMPMKIVRGTDMNGTAYQEQVPFYHNGRLDKQRIRSGKNYKYGFMSDSKQTFILNVIEEVIKTQMINKKTFHNEDEYIDLVLNVLLNLDNSIIKMIQWFEFYTDNPNLVLTITDENTLQLEDMILLLFMHMMGFDILIFIPTCYKSISDLVTNRFQYDKHIIGQATYNLNVANLYVSKDKVVNIDTPKLKKGMFSKLKDWLC